jgi:hypothetical protein
LCELLNHYDLSFGFAFLLKFGDANAEKLHLLPVMPEIQPSQCGQSRGQAV